MRNGMAHMRLWRSYQKDATMPHSAPENSKKSTGRAAQNCRQNIAIVTEGKMLTDEYIQFANELLRDQFPHARGLQWTVLGQTLAFQKTDPPFIQVLFNNATHWVMVEAVDDATIRVYDSTNCRPNLSVQVQDKIYRKGVRYPRIC